MHCAVKRKQPSSAPAGQCLLTHHPTFLPAGTCPFLTVPGPTGLPACLPACARPCPVPACRQSGDVKLAVSIFVSGWIAQKADFESAWQGCIAADSGACGWLPAKPPLQALCGMHAWGGAGSRPGPAHTLQTAVAGCAGRHHSPYSPPPPFLPCRLLHTRVGEQGAPAAEQRAGAAADHAGRWAGLAAGHPQFPVCRRGAGGGPGAHCTAGYRLWAHHLKRMGSGQRASRQGRQAGAEHPAENSVP
jgi:hypothetical protein